MANSVQGSANQITASTLISTPVEFYLVGQ